MTGDSGVTVRSGRLPVAQDALAHAERHRLQYLLLISKPPRALKTAASI
jgi:hypothetical protein